MVYREDTVNYDDPYNGSTATTADLVPDMQRKPREAHSKILTCRENPGRHTAKY